MKIEKNQQPFQVVGELDFAPSAYCGCAVCSGHRLFARWSQAHRDKNFVRRLFPKQRPYATQDQRVQVYLW